jgi:predicted acyl esterase
MPRLVLFLIGLLLAWPASASAFTKEEHQLTMSDGVRIAATYYFPDGPQPAGGWPAVMLLHGLGESRDDASNAVGISMNQVAETYLVPQGYAALTFDARGHGQSGGLVGVDGPREIQDVREVFNWLAARAEVNAQHIGAYGYSYGGGAIWRATAEGVPFQAIVPATSWTDLYSALAPQNFAHSGVVLGFYQSIANRASPELQPIVNDLLSGQNLPAVHAFADARSSRALLANIHVPTFVMQGRRDFAFDTEQALAAYSRLNVPKRLYLADFGHAPASQPPAEVQHVLPEAREWFDRYLKGLPNGIDTRPPVEIAPDPWTGRTFSYTALPKRKTLKISFGGRKSIGATAKVARTRPKLKTKAETFGSPVLRVSLSSPNRWPHVVAVLSAVTRGKEIVVSAGGTRVKLGRKPKQVTIRMLSQVTALPRGSRLRLTVAATSTAQSPQDLLYLLAVPRSARLTVGPAKLSLPVLSSPISG